MTLPFTAVLRLDESSPSPTAEALDALLRPVRGVFDVRLGPAASTVTVVFDHRLVGLGTLVRLIEDGGGFVCGIRRDTAADAAAGSARAPTARGGSG